MLIKMYTDKIVADFVQPPPVKNVKYAHQEEEKLKVNIACCMLKLVRPENRLDAKFNDFFI